MTWHHARRAFALALLLSFASRPGFGQDAPPAPTNDDCLMCHGDTGAQRADGSPVFVDATKFAGSVHGQLELACTACHVDLAAAEFPHAEKLEPAQCSACHDASAFEASIHGRAVAAGKTPAPTCWSCHGSHDILPSADPQSRTHHLNVMRVCAQCHGASGADQGRPGGNVAALFEDSIHGRALLRSGLNVAPSCISCHGAHDIAPPNEVASKVHRSNVASTCGACHEGIKLQYVGGTHGSLVQNGDPRAPVCADCHSAHGIQRADVEQWQVDVILECGSCHTDKLRTYRDTFHGKVTELGFARVATCASCHGAHQVLPASNPASPVSPERRLQTCQKCHAGVNANFAAYDPHADTHDRARNPLLFYTARFMEVLLLGVFSFFGIHSGLWFTRSWKEVRRHRAATLSPGPASAAKGPADEENQR